MVATQVLAKVEGQRLQKVVEGLVRGAYTITLAGQAEGEIRGFVANAAGKEYGVVLSEGQPSCSCRDAMYRKAVCKHMVALALHAIRHPRAEQATEERPVEEQMETQSYNLKLRRMRPGFIASA